MANLWDQETDVLIVGYGGAGATAAIAAHDAGARVLIVEKDRGGGNTRLATMTFLCPVKGPAAREHIRALSFGALDEETIDAYVEWSSQNVEFVKQLGGQVEVCPPGPTFPSVPGSESMIRYRVKPKQGELGGESLWNLLSQNVERRGIPVQRHTPAKKLVRSGDEIIGIEAEQAGELLRVRARRAVVLSTGGFEYNEEMKREYLAGYPIHAFGHAGNRGDGKAAGTSGNAWRGAGWRG